MRDSFEKFADLKIKRFDHEIAAHEQFLATHPTADELSAETTQKLKAAKQKRAEILIADARERMDPKPHRSSASL